ncbi:maltase 2-like isoform X2 [Teleopsis dalmanni]|nr:maltase 2-like isoform X2 [Teleopsis dalmanni]XP_037961164.1 maltase 2-like isoform X2 [Teleopsis dalmanni]
MATAATASTATEPATDWWQHAVFYQIYPRSFSDSDGDGIGDLRGIIQRLPYLAETGITAAWLSPIFQSPMVDFGYDISDFKAIHSEYGTMQDFEDLIAEANRLDIKIILDFVPNHSSDQCEWFKKSAERIEGFEDFYVWADGEISEDGERVPPNNWQSVFYGSAWTWHETRQQYYLHQFTVQQPDLNFRNEAVLKAIDDVMYFWLDKGVSGFRVDAVNHLFEVPELSDEPLSGKTSDKNSYEYTKHIYTKDLPEVNEMVQHWRLLLDDYSAKHGGSARIMMTEAYADLKKLMDYYENEKGVKGSHIPFNFLFITDLNADSDARDFVYNIQKWLTYMPRKHAANWVMGNHDNPRVASRFGPQLVDALNMLLMTLPGVAVTYNGEEIGMQDYRDISWEDTVDPPARNVGPLKYQKVSRDPVRTPFQWNADKNAGFSSAAKTWLPVHPNYKQLNLEAQKLADKSHYKLYKMLLELRKSPVLREGRLHAEVLNRAVFAFKRELKGQPTVFTLINLGNQTEIVDLTNLIDAPERLTVAVAGTESELEAGQMLSLNMTFHLMKYEAVILRAKYSAFLADRHALIKTFIKSMNIILVGLLMYKLWNNKWTKLNFNKQAIF